MLAFNAEAICQQNSMYARVYLLSSVSAVMSASTRPRNRIHTESILHVITPLFDHLYRVAGA